MNFTHSKIKGQKGLFEKVFGVEQPQWFWDLALELRIPALVCAWAVYKNTRLYYDALSSYNHDSKWAMTKGKLVELTKQQYRFISVPRYTVTYEYEVNGVKYTSTRATTGSPYRNWMHFFYRDCITESQYLQAMPILRVGERCTVFYDKSNPSGHSALAHDPNSWEMSLLAFAAALPLLMGYYMKAHYVDIRRAYAPARKIKVGFPKVDHPKPAPPPPRQPTQISPIPK